MTERDIPKPTIDRICNRHMRRLLQNLEEDAAPQLIIDAVKKEMVWLRQDLREAFPEANEE